MPDVAADAVHLMHAQVAGLELLGDRLGAALRQPRRLPRMTASPEEVLLGQERRGRPDSKTNPSSTSARTAIGLVAREAGRLQDLQGAVEAAPCPPRRPRSAHRRGGASARLGRQRRRRRPAAPRRPTDAGRGRCLRTARRGRRGPCRRTPPRAPRRRGRPATRTPRPGRPPRRRRARRGRPSVAPAPGRRATPTGAGPPRTAGGRAAAGSPAPSPRTPAPRRAVPGSSGTGRGCRTRSSARSARSRVSRSAISSRHGWISSASIWPVDSCVPVRELAERFDLVAERARRVPGAGRWTGRRRGCRRARRTRRGARPRRRARTRAPSGARAARRTATVGSRAIVSGSCAPRSGEMRCRTARTGAATTSGPVARRSRWAAGRAAPRRQRPGADPLVRQRLPRGEQHDALGAQPRGRAVRERLCRTGIGAHGQHGRIGGDGQRGRDEGVGGGGGARDDVLARQRRGERRRRLREQFRRDLPRFSWPPLPPLVHSPSCGPAPLGTARRGLARRTRPLIRAVRIRLGAEPG